MASSPKIVRSRSSYHGVLQRQHSRGAPSDENSVSAALARLSQTTDGDILLKWIHQQTYGRTLPDDASEGALRASEARKSFATTIFNLLDRGLSENAAAKRNGK